MSPETATDPRIRPAIAPVARPRAVAAAPAAAPERPEAPFAARPGSGGNRVSDLGPGADHPTAAGDFGFAELLDVINPLQHLPVVSSLYRRVTGDRIEAPARIMGATLYGGPAGFVLGTASALAAEVVGADPGEQVLAALLGPSDGGPPDVALAEGRPRGAQHPPSARQNGPEPASGQAASAAPSRDLRVAPEVPADARALFAERMMAALDKYEGLAAARTDPPQSGPDGLDLSL